MDADVVIVGAGPTGLLLAGDLAEAGVSVSILERRTTESNVTRAFAVHARTMEELQIRGVAAELAKTGAPIRTLRLFGRVRIDLSRLPTEFASLLITPQCRTEQVLQRRADALGVRTVRGAQVIGVTQDEHGVDVSVHSRQGATTFRASYAVGADGVDSTGLLDSYHNERRPVGRQVLRSSGAIIRLAMIKPRWLRMVRNVTGQILLAIPPVGAAAAAEISGLAVSYPALRGAERRVGTRAPDVALRDGRLYEALRGGRFVLLGADAPSVDLPPQVDAAVPAQPIDRLLLVRPDGYLAWVGTADEFPAWARGYFRWPHRAVR